MSLRPAIPVFACLLLAACATPATDAPTAVAGQCNAEAAQAHVGHAAGAEMVEAARKDAGAELVRVLKPGQPMTMDYRIERLNLYLDANGNIERIACG